MENLQKISSMGNLVPFQSLTADQQRRCIELYGDPDDTQRRRIPGVYKTPSEKEILSKPCKVGYKSELHQKTMDVVCKTCRKLSNAALSGQLTYFGSTGNTPGRLCLYEMVVDTRQMRTQIGGTRLSHSQVCKWMQGVLEVAKCQTGNSRRKSDRDKSPNNSVSNA